MFDVAAHVDEITALVQRASSLSLQWFRRPMTVENKGSGQTSDRQIERFDPVTAADRAVEDALRDGLSELFSRPDFGGTHSIFGEERGASGSGRYRWVIDPIDGTRAFIAGQPLWGTILGLQDLEKSAVVAGWLHQPTLTHTYVASPAGAELWEADRRVPLQASAVTSVEDAVLVCTHPSMFTTDPERAAFDRVDSVARLTRFGGDCLNYGYLASGYADLVIENQLQPYDIIPLVPIVERAGGVITDLEGGSVANGGWAIAAATPELHQATLDLLNG